MCGFVGILSLSNSVVIDKKITSEVESSLMKIQHRGPDGFHVVTSERFALGHVRLSIIDLSPEGRQPLLGSNGSSLLFNGEIYNYKKLAEKYNVAGGRNATSDTKVLFSLLNNFGESIIHELDGMFSFVFVDSGGQIILARDRFGIKPLFYSVQNGCLKVASEIRALPGISLKPDQSVMFDYLRTGFYPAASNSTFFSEVKQVQPGICSIYRKGEEVASETSFVTDIDLGFPPRSSSDLDVVLASISEKIAVSDVPICFSLSGGVDSTLSLATFSAGREHTLGQIHAISSEPFSSELSEVALAKRTANKLNVQLHVCAPPRIHSEHEAFAEMLRLTDILEAPVRSAGVFMQEAVYRKAHDLGFKVIIDGEGADDILGAYYGNISSTISQLVREVGPVAAFREVRRLADRTGLRWANIFAKVILLNIQRRTSLGGPITNKQSRVSEINDLVGRSSLPTLVHWGDRLSMRYSLEARPFYLFQEFRDWSNGLLAAQALSNGYNKWPLRNQLARVHSLPEVAFNPRKLGYSTVSAPFQKLVMQTLTDSSWQYMLNEAFNSSNTKDPIRTTFRILGAYTFMRNYATNI
jgi:asparagine synthase (glutamine-hydrolysing)